MVNIMMFLGFIYLGGQIIGMISLGGSGLAATTLSQALTATSTTVNVRSTAGFLDADLIIIKEEFIRYTGRTSTSFTGITRGYQNTDAVPHPNGARVYNESTGIINLILGFNIVQTFADDGFIKGAIKSVTSVPKMLSHAVPKLIGFNYPFFEGPAVWLKYFFFASFGVGMIASLLLFIRRGG